MTSVERDETSMSPMAERLREEEGRAEREETEDKTLVADTGRPRRSSRDLFNRLARAMIRHLEQSMNEERTVNLIRKHHEKGELAEAKVRRECGAAVCCDYEEAMRTVIAEAFEHFDVDKSRTINKTEIQNFLASYSEWMHENHWDMLQRPRLRHIVKTFSGTLLKSMGNQSERYRSPIEKIIRDAINFEEFETAANEDVKHISVAMKRSKERVAENLLSSLDKDSDGVLDYEEFTKASNLDYLVHFGRNPENQHEPTMYARLWKQKSAEIIAKIGEIDLTEEPRICPESPRVAPRPRRSVEASGACSGCAYACIVM